MSDIKITTATKSIHKLEVVLNEEQLRAAIYGWLQDYHLEVIQDYKIGDLEIDTQNPRGYGTVLVTATRTEES